MTTQIFEPTHLSINSARAGSAGDGHRGQVAYPEGGVVKPWLRVGLVVSEVMVMLRREDDRARHPAKPRTLDCLPLHASPH